MKRFSLRQFVLLATAVAVTAGALATAAQLTRPQAGYYRFMLGEVEVTSLSDGTLPFDFDQLLVAKPGEVSGLLKNVWAKEPLNASVNAYLLKIGTRLILVDAGSGELYGPTLNKLTISLKAAGHLPEQITDILLTHIHTDHSGGLMNGSRRVFPNATVHVDRREADHWLNQKNAEKASELQRKFFGEAERKVKPYLHAGKLQTFNGETELFRGLRSLPADGHTPGHTFYVLESKGEKLVFWGDVLHVTEVQFPSPSVTIAFDTDQKAAAHTRQEALTEAAQEGYLAAPAHTSFPGIGRVARDGEGFRWLPAPYINDAKEKRSGRWSKSSSNHANGVRLVAGS